MKLKVQLQRDEESQLRSVMDTCDQEVKVIEDHLHMYDVITNQRTSMAYDEGAFEEEMAAFVKANPHLQINIEEFDMPSSPSFPKHINVSNQKNRLDIIEEERPTPTNVSNMKNIWKSYDIAANPKVLPPTGRLPPNSNVLVSQASPGSQYSQKARYYGGGVQFSNTNSTMREVSEVVDITRSNWKPDNQGVEPSPFSEIESNSKSALSPLRSRNVSVD